MSYTIELIDQYKLAKGLESDYAVAKAMDFTPNRISNYRRGISHADDKMAVVLADALGLDRLKTIARINADRAGDAQTRAFWKRIATAAGVMIMISATTLPVRAYAAIASEKQGISSEMYIMSILRAFLRAVLRRSKKTRMISRPPAIAWG